MRSASQWGCDMHLAMLTDSMAEHLRAGRFVSVASLDVGGEFDTVSHDGLMSSLWETVADAYLGSFIGTWMRGRYFGARALAPEGRFLCRAKGISRGLPQSGVLSPLLWLVHYNRFFRLIESPLGPRRSEDPKGRIHGIRLGYADDVTFAYEHEQAAEIVKLANSGCAQPDSALKELHRALGLDKCNNRVLSPGEIIGAAFRRESGQARTVGDELAARDRRLAELLATVEADKLPWGVFPPSLGKDLPYTYADSFRALGVTLDARMGFEKHVEAVMAEAQSGPPWSGIESWRNWQGRHGAWRWECSAVLTRR